MPETKPHRTPTDTREALLDAAENLFAEKGLQAASLRAITSAAGANLAAVHYHFGSKEGLVKALFARRLGPLNGERLAWLERSEKAAAPDPPAVDELVRAFVAPVIRMLRDHEQGGRPFARLIGRAIFGLDAGNRQILVDELRPVVQRFLAAFRRARPDLPEVEIHWRFHFMAGAMGRLASLGDPEMDRLKGLCDPGDMEGMTDYLVAFLASGWQAPTTKPGAGAAAPPAADSP